MKTRISVICGLLLALISVRAWAFGGPRANPPLDTVQSVDLSRYLGTWYEIARLPQSFEKNCAEVTAQYSFRDDGKLDVLNSCLDTETGKVRTAHGTAEIVDSHSNAKLRVTFFWPFYGDYWILELGQNYEYAVVGSPDRETFWILSRTSTLPAETVHAIVERFSKKGFELEKLIMTRQS